jgi:uncharacterized protein (TIGR02118 family)
VTNREAATAVTMGRRGAAEEGELSVVKLTVLYGPPTDPAAFERYYAATHLPLVAKIPGAVRIEKAKVIGAPASGAPLFHRIFELWFESQEQMQTALGSPAGQAAIADIPNYATGG